MWGVSISFLYFDRVRLIGQTKFVMRFELPVIFCLYKNKIASMNIKGSKHKYLSCFLFVVFFW